MPALMPVQEYFDAGVAAPVGGGYGGVVRLAVERGAARRCAGKPDAEVARAAREKDKQVLAEVAYAAYATGKKRTAFPAGYTFGLRGSTRVGEAREAACRQ
jgi:hypothetical protein